MVETLQHSQGLILAGKVLVDGQRVDKPGTQVDGQADISLTGDEIPYVSRGGLKLKAALDRFGLDVTGLVCADIGASTGGFTDCLLQEGAAKVYAVDVGYGIIDMRLRRDPRVVLIERTNVRFLEPCAFGEKADLATIDVSFISLRLVLGPVMAMLKPGGSIIALVKPQFEVNREHVGEGGIVRDAVKRAGALDAVKEFATTLGLKPAGEIESPVKGAKGNIEYLLFLKLP